MNISGTGDSDSDRPVKGHEASSSRPRQLRTVLLSLFGVGLCTLMVTWMLRESPARPDGAFTSALEAMRAADPAARKTAIRSVAQVGLAESARSIPAVIEALADKDATVRASAAESLGLLGSYAVWARMTGTVAEGQDQGTIDTATKALFGSMASDAQPFVRAAAARGLGNISATSPPPARSKQGSKKGGAKGKAKAEEGAVPSPVDYQATVAALIAALADKDDEVRASAAAALGAAGPKVSAEPPPPLVAALKDQSAATRAATAKAVCNFPSGLDPVMPTLIKLSAEKDRTVHEACLQALREIKKSAISAASVPALVEGLKNPDRQIRLNLVTLLARLGREAKDAVPALIAVLNEPLTSDSTMGGGSGGAFVTLFVGPAHEAAKALGEIVPGTPLAGEAVAALANVVRSGAPQRRGSAATALAEFGATAKPAIPDLIKMLEDADTDKTSAASRDAEVAAKTLAEIAADPPSTDAVLSALRKSLHSNAKKSRAAVVGAIAELGPKAASAAPDIQAFEKDPDPNVQSAAVKALEALRKE